jgi:hypothetical protein
MQTEQTHRNQIEDRSADVREAFDHHSINIVASESVSQFQIIGIGQPDSEMAQVINDERQNYYAAEEYGLCGEACAYNLVIHIPDRPGRPVFQREFDRYHYMQDDE